MKEQWTALLTGCVLVCSILAGCGSRPQTSAPTAAGSDKSCTDEAILSQLKNDGTPEFVLDGICYTLPLGTSQLIQTGWSLETKEYDTTEASLQPGKRIYGELSKNDQEMSVVIVNTGTEPCGPAEGETMVELEYSTDEDQPDPNFFVALNGVNYAMSNATLQKAPEGVDGYELNSVENIDINHTVDDDEIAVYKVTLDDDYTAIALASDNAFEYKDYQPREIKEQTSNEKITAYKGTTKAEMEPYAQGFSAITEGYEENMIVGFHSEGTIWGEEAGEYRSIAGAPLATDVSLYIAEDTTGQLYCISNQLLNKDGTANTAIELKEGDQVKVQGYTSQYLELQEGLKIVVVQPGIIERNGRLVILDENLKID